MLPRRAAVSLVCPRRCDDYFYTPVPDPVGDVDFIGRRIHIERRRTIQIAYNEKHGITPQTIRKKVRDVIEATKVAEAKSSYLTGKDDLGKLSKKDRLSVIERLEAEMKEAAKSLQFERAAELRDALLELKAGM